MLNLKMGMVIFDVGKIVGELKVGRVEFCVDKVGIIHVVFGCLSFMFEKFEDNLCVIIECFVCLKFVSVKLSYFCMIMISSTMGFGIKFDILFVVGMF